MNEFYAAEPVSFSNATELQLLLDKFGPYAGRYLAGYPEDWREQVGRCIDGWSWLEQEKAKTLLRRGQERCKVFTPKNWPWDQERPWVENALHLTSDELRKCQAVIVAKESTKNRHGFIFSIDNLDLPPIADEIIPARADQYERVCRMILKISEELILIDPYMNLADNRVTSVIEALLRSAARGRAKYALLWARAKLVAAHNQDQIDEIRGKMKDILKSSAVRTGFKLRYKLVDDDRSKDRLHGRYLVSIKGGVKLEQGFQTLTEGRGVEVSPIGQATHEDLVRKFLENSNDLKIVRTIEVVQ